MSSFKNGYAFYDKHTELCNEIDDLFMPSVEDLEELREVLYKETEFGKIGAGRRHIFDKAFNLAFESLHTYEDNKAVKIYEKVNLLYAFFEAIS